MSQHQQILEETQKLIQVLRDPNASDSQKADTASSLRLLVGSDEAKQLAVEKQGAVPPLVKLLKEGSDRAKKEAANALYALSGNKQLAQAIVAAGGKEPLVALARDCREDDDVKWGRTHALRAMPNLHKAETAEAGSGPKQFQAQVKALESDSSEEQRKAAEQLGTWAASSDENRVAIHHAGGAEALVALVVTGSDDAKCHAARALRHLANHKEAKEKILKADGIAVLAPLAKHGKGKVKEAASEALNLLSMVAAKPSPAAAATSIPTGEGTRVAMFSARFDGGPVEQLFRKVFKILQDNKYDILMVAADAGKSFGDLTAKYLGRLRSEQGTMIAVCTKHYGEMTASSYSSHEELKFALEYKSSMTVLPLQVEDTYPPKPPGGPDHKFDKEKLAQGYIDMVFRPSVVRLDCRNSSGQLKSETDIAVDIAKELQKYKL